jgi:hypothetical protein
MIDVVAAVMGNGGHSIAVVGAYVAESPKRVHSAISAGALVAES